jgi:hypothetical protein
MTERRGWLIGVDTKQINNGRAASSLYAARIADPAAAMSAVRKYAKANGANLQIIVETSIAQLRRIKVPKGKVRRIKSGSPRITP